ncbi:tudor and KH domain-containing protein homolog [Cephus cinctus]|uniref:Tudor and KH domain-containing protein homolog n=1 Tax=Cephus cinctus TaxID=211228 RepID=A0AAJ7FKS1_CEPCN|nr:tudor and KH domain-containing protein homolog [Cephus cinctus]
MKSISQQIVLPVVLGLSLTSIGVGLLYLLLKKDKDNNITKNNQVGKAHQSVSFLKVPSQVVPAVIGRQGQIIKNIEANTESSIKFAPPDIESKDRVCIIRGKPESIQLAEHMINTIIQSQPIIETYETFIPQRACSRVIGRGGETIQQIQTYSSAKIILEKTLSNNPDAKRRVIIKGSSEQIATALSLIEEKVREDNEAREELEASLACRLPRGKISPRNTVVNVSENAALPPEPTIMPGFSGLMEVYVSAMESPSQFWVQVVGKGSIALDKLVSEMTTYYDNPDNQELHTLKNINVGQMVAAKFSFDKLWYRAEVTSIIEADSYEAYFVDYGDREIMKAADMLELRTDFLSLRLQAIECCLANVKPRDGEWSQDASEKFADMCQLAQWKVLVAKVRGYKERAMALGRSRREGSPIPCIELYDKQDNKDINVGKELINEGMAEFDQGPWSAASSTLSLTKRGSELSSVASPIHFDVTSNGSAGPISLNTNNAIESKLNEPSDDLKTTQVNGHEKTAIHVNGTNDHYSRNNVTLNDTNDDFPSEIPRVVAGGYESDYSESDELEMG